MKPAETVTVLGVRGSFPVVNGDFMEYGGNTSCFLVDLGGETVILDAGSGLSSLGNAVPLPGGRKHVHILLSHLHLDHIIGLLSFSLLHDAAAEIYLYGEAYSDTGLQSCLDAVLGPPYWPLRLNDFQARVQVRELTPGIQISLGDNVILSTLRGNHPGNSLLYRLDAGEKTIVYALDCELDRNMSTTLTSFARNADLLIWDASFAPEDLKTGWGHSTWQEGLVLGRQADVKQILMTHYFQSYSDSFLSEQEKLAREDNRCLFAKEGMVLKL